MLPMPVDRQVHVLSIVRLTNDSSSRSRETIADDPA